MSDPTTRIVVARYCTCLHGAQEHGDSGDGPCDAVDRFRNVYTGQVNRNLPAQACECQQFTLESVVYADQPHIRHTLGCPCHRCQAERDAFEAAFAERLRVSESFRNAVAS